MIEAVIFDVDGTLVDSVDMHAEAWQRAFAHFGYDLGFDEVRAQIGKGGDQLLPVFLDEDERARIGEALERYRGELFVSEYLDAVRGFPGAAELLEAVRARGIRIALASSAKGDELKVYKKAAGISDLTDVETCSDDAERTKPHPDIFQAALAKLGLSPDAAVVVGDTPYDAEAAAKAGIASVGVLCGGFPEAEIRRRRRVAHLPGSHRPQSQPRRVARLSGGRPIGSRDGFAQ